MKQLLDIADTFQTSRPVFRLTMDMHYGRISANVRSPMFAWRPVPEQGNVLSHIVCDEFAESFFPNSGTFGIDTYQIANRAMNFIRKEIVNFIEHNLQMRNPKQSKLWRWYARNAPKTDDFNDILIMLFKYICYFRLDQREQNPQAPHIKNTLIILETLMEKYE